MTENEVFAILAVIVGAFAASFFGSLLVLAMVNG